MEDLIKRIEVLEKYKADREQQQITLPLDQQSIDILNQYFFRVKDIYVYTVTGASSHVIAEVIGEQKDVVAPITGLFRTNKISFAFSNTVPYVVDPTSNFITAGDGMFLDDAEVTVYTSDTEPSGLTAGDTYYVRDSTGNRFKLSLTVGGAAIDITDGGTGRQFIQQIL